MPYPYVTRVELERELPFGAVDFGIDDSNPDADGNTDWDYLLDTVLEREADRIEGWLDARFEQTTLSAELDGSGEADLPLDNRPVADVTALSVDTGAATETLDVATDIHVADTHVELLDAAPISRFHAGRRNVAITYVHGYDGAPGPIQEAIIRLARNGLDMIETDGIAQESEGSFNYSYRPPEELKAEVWTAVSEHRPPSYYSGVYTS